MGLCGIILEGEKCALQSLNVSDNRITGAAKNEISRQLLGSGPAALKILDLSRNPIGDETVICVFSRKDQKPISSSISCISFDE